MNINHRITTKYWEIYSKQITKSESSLNPPGYTSIYSKKGQIKKLKNQVDEGNKSDIRDELKVKKAWEIAIGPAKQLPMTAFMMYMSGNTVQIFSMMMTFMMFFNPIQALSTTTNLFSPLQNGNTRNRLFLPKFVFILLQVVGIGLGVWKAASMGLLPTSASDWLAWEKVSKPFEQSFFISQVE